MPLYSHLYLVGCHGCWCCQHSRPLFVVAVVESMVNSLLVVLCFVLSFNGEPIVLGVKVVVEMGLRLR